MKTLPYDKTSKYSIQEYSQTLIGKTFKDIINENQNLDSQTKTDLITKFNNPKSKGSLGNLIEEYFFFYKPNSDSDADFPEAGVELKLTPYIQNKNKSLSAKERLVLTIIDYMTVFKYNFESSHVYEKCILMLLIYYFHESDIDRIDFIIKYAKLFTFPEVDLEIIKQDYNTIITKIKEGKAHEISEGDTMYLGACTKGENKNSVRIQPFSDVMASQRAFCLKQKYMTEILRNYMSNNAQTYESAIKDSSILKNKKFEDYIIEKLSKYYGQDVEFLKHKFNIDSSLSNKSFTYLLAKNMLDIINSKNNKIDEFEKANIKIKAITLHQKKSKNQHMSFPAFKYTEIINEHWETSTLYETFSTTKYLFMVYEEIDKNTVIFKKALFWNVPMKDLNTEIKAVWQKTVALINENKYYCLPKTTESPILHVRPHGRNNSDVYPTPDGKFFKKQCFWFHKNYIHQQLDL